MEQTGEGFAGEKILATKGVAEKIDLKSLLEVPLEQVFPNPKQPRKVFSEGEVASLARSIKKDGFLQPLVVLPKNERGYYFLVAGERRLRAAKALSLLTVPVVIKNASTKDALRLALIENVQRQDLGVVEEAVAYKELIEEHSLTHEGCAEALGVDRSKVTNTIRLLSLPEKALDSLVEDKITMGHARSLLSLKENPPLLLEVLSLVLEKGLSVRQTESVCRKLKKQGEGNKAKTLDQERTNPNIEYYADILRQELKTKVKLTGSGGRGKIEISYFSLAEFERLFEVFCGKKL